MAAEYDLVVIGGGAAGIAAARAGVGRRARVLLISEGEIGGECTFTGCVPSKTLIEAAARGAGFGAAMKAVAEAVARIAATETAEVLAGEGIEVLRARAVFTRPGEIDAGGRLVRGRRFVIATGSRPSVPPVPGLAEVGYLTNEDVFGLAEPPARLAVLGGGAVGCELAQAFARLGSRVTIVEAADRLLPAADPEASEVIAEVFAGEGIAVRTGAAVIRAEPASGGMAGGGAAGGGMAGGGAGGGAGGERGAGRAGPGGTALVVDGGERVVTDRVLVAAGRRAASDGLGLEAAGVRVDARGRVITGRDLSTSAKGVYAAGDVTGLMPFTHAAYAMGRLAAGNALRRPGRPAVAFRAGAIPWVVFTEPEVAQVGLTEAEAAGGSGGRGARVAYLPMSETDRAVAAGRTAGFVKLIAGRRPVLGAAGGGRVLGATIVAERAGEMIAEVALAMRTRMFTGRLAQTAHAYPTWSIAVQQAAAQFFGEFDGRTARPCGFDGSILGSAGLPYKRRAALLPCDCLEGDIAWPG